MAHVGSYPRLGMMNYLIVTGMCCQPFFIHNTFLNWSPSSATSMEGDAFTYEPFARISARKKRKGKVQREMSSPLDLLRRAKEDLYADGTWLSDCEGRVARCSTHKTGLIPFLWQSVYGSPWGTCASSPERCCVSASEARRRLGTLERSSHSSLDCVRLQR